MTALQAMTKATEAVAEFSKHEAVCAERYLTTEKTLTSPQGLLRRVGVTAIAAPSSLAIWGGEQFFTAGNAKSGAQTAQFAALNSRIGALAKASQNPPTACVVNSTQAPAAAPVPAPYAPVSEPGQVAHQANSSSETAMHVLHRAREIARRCFSIHPSASTRPVDHIVADFRRLLMTTSATAASILDQVNGLPGAIAAQEAAALAAAEASATAAHQADLDSIAAAVTAVGTGVGIVAPAA